jgi:hypothetical protein
MIKISNKINYCKIIICKQIIVIMNKIIAMIKILKLIMKTKRNNKKINYIIYKLINHKLTRLVKVIVINPYKRTDFKLYIN